MPFVLIFTMNYSQHIYIYIYHSQDTLRNAVFLNNEQDILVVLTQLLSFHVIHIGLLDPPVICKIGPRPTVIVPQ